jgi:hypothetical protein
LTGFSEIEPRPIKNQDFLGSKITKWNFFQLFHSILNWHDVVFRLANSGFSLVFFIFCCDLDEKKESGNTSHSALLTALKYKPQ